MAVAFCITWWVVTGEAWQARTQAYQASEQAEQASEQAEQAYEQAEQASRQAEQALAQTSRPSVLWGMGAALLVKVLLLVGALAWSKLTAKA